NPQDEPPEGITLQEWAERSEDPIGLYTPHAAPMQWAYYNGSAFPDEYHGDAFVAMRGSWNRRPPSGYEVVRVRFQNGEPRGFEPFVTGFLTQDDNGWGHYGRLAGIAEAQDGALLLSDDTNGVIYRIAHTGGYGASTATHSNPEWARTGMLGKPPASPPPETPAQLASTLVTAEATLSVRSSAFEEGGRIPDPFAADSQNISPPLSWTSGPEGTGSYAVIMEDPDAMPN